MPVHMIKLCVGCDTVEELLAWRAGEGAAPSLYRRIIEVIEMQNNTDEWQKKYDTLVQAKIDRLKSLSPDAMAELRQKWAVLIADVQQALEEDPATRFNRDRKAE